MAYTTAQLNASIAALESGLAKSYAKVTHEGKELEYRSVAEILQAIGYFKSLLNNATDSPGAGAVDKRTFFLYGGGGR